MNTPTISAVLPVAGKPGTRPSQGSAEADTAPASFSQVLDQQHAANGPARPASPSAHAPADPVKGQQPKPGTKADAAPIDDEALAEAASEQGLTLAQITLGIAAEVAAVQLPTAQLQGRGSARPSDPSMKAGPVPAGLATALSADAVLEDVVDPRGATARPVLNQAEATASGAKAIPLDVLLNSAGGPQTATEPTAPRGRLAANEALRASMTGTAAKAKPIGQAITAQAAEAGHSKAVADFSAAMAAAGGPVAAVNAAAASDAAGALAGSLSAVAHSATTATGSVNVPQAGSPTLAPLVATPLQSPLWAADFSRQFVSITQAGHTMPHTAELRLDPPDLGPLRISLQITDNVAHAAFISPHAAVRQTVENALPQLQELLAQAGISLGQTSVSDQGQPGQAGQESNGGMARPGMATASVGGMDTGNAPLQAATRARAPDALIDTFA